MTDPSSPVLRAALAACLPQLGLVLSHGQIEALLVYLQLLQRWNAVYNLTAVRDLPAMLTQHVVDCLAIIPPLRREIGANPATVIDVGSGGGLPAVVVAIALPDVQITSVDAVGKKTAFVRQVAGELSLKNLAVAQGRIESLRLPPVDVVTSRAFASLDDFVRMSRSILKSDGRWLAMKGKVPTQEIEAVQASAEVFHVEPLTVPGLTAERCIVWMRRLAETPASYH